MPIPTEQLETWTNQGGSTSSMQTHQAIQMAINSFSGWQPGTKIDLYLQGSYKNDTNTRTESDVDVVAELTSTFFWNIENLPLDQQQIFKMNLPQAQPAYSWENYRQDVNTALVNYFGANSIEVGNKALRLKPSAGRRKADIIASCHLQYYMQYQPPNNIRFYNGIILKNISTGQWVLNFPKIHYDNGVNKNALFKTNIKYKRIVRLFKNFRNHLINSNLLNANQVPSYYLECLLYNVPDELFGGDLGTATVHILRWLIQTKDKSQFVCQNGVFYLFGPRTEQWNLNDADQFIQTAAQAWDNWR